MNRIYQGKVVDVAIHTPGNKDNPWQPLPNWQGALWHHHELFQDAVNYYTLALAAMAEGVNADTAQGAAVLEWRAQVRENWRDGRRKALRYEGPHHRLAARLGVDAGIADGHAAFDASTQAILNNNGASPAQRAAALLQLLEEADKSDLNQVCRDRIVPLCSPLGKCDATPKDIVAQQTRKMLAAVQRLHNYVGQDWTIIANELDPGWFITRMPDKLLQGSSALKEALKRFGMVCKDDPLLKEQAKSFEENLRQRGDALSVHTPGRKVKGPYSLAVVFKLWPCAATAEALKRMTSGLLKQTSPEIRPDPLFAARANDAPVFDYFTNRAFHGAADDKNQAAWKEFDIAAFLEAIKAPHRYLQDTQKRKAAADLVHTRIAAMEYQSLPSGDDEANADANFGFAEDQRIALLRDLVTDPVNGLAYLAETEGSAAGTAEYTIQERTLRGWTAIRDKWRILAWKGEATPERFWNVVASEQATHRDDFGSAMLYKKLAEPRYHTIWRDKGTRPWHAIDPLRAWLQYTELRLELADKTRPIRFTPAHAIHSPRYFIFPKKSAAGGRWGSEHETGALAFSAGIAIRDGERWRPQMARVLYSAPRLNRDELRRPEERGLDSAPWLQPMMKALGLPEPAQQDFGKCRITLQPSSPEDIQLTFPVEVDPAKLIAHLGKQSTWSRQFNVTPDGDEFRDATLRWPHEKRPSKAPTPWHDVLDSFHCLSVDLGQREAGAFALLDVHANHTFAKRPFHFIGETPGKRWHAALVASGLLRLSGEDRDEWRAKTSKDGDNGEAFDFREELHGSRGRMPRSFETDDCRDLLDLFLGPGDSKNFLPPGWDDPQSHARLSFPKQNDKLLIAARRAQSRLARLHRWCWFLGEEKKRADAMAEIRESLNTADEAAEHWLPAGLKEFAKTDNDPRLIEGLKNLLDARLKELSALLERLATRILPLRGRSWKWERHPDATNENRIHLLTQNGPSLDSQERPVWLRGQRGLSTERIEQIEELRKRFQSLNQTLRRDIGGKPPIRRDERVPDPCPDLLDKLDHLKQQRVNQTAHMIIAEGLGVRLAKPPANKAALRKERDQHGVYEKLRAPADFIVIEDLSRYRASQGRAPRENSRLMKWCHRAVRDKLRELCEPFGIPVLETPAAYSSRFCSRTGVPGFRAVEVTAGFENEAPWCWWKDKESDGKLTEEAQFIRRTADELRKAQSALEAERAAKHPGKKAPRRTLLLPQAGGPIFIPAVEFTGSDGLSSAVAQADINAAISLGLRAIANPRLWEIHPRLRTERVGGEVKKRGGKKKSEELAKADEPIRLKAREKRKYGENGPKLNLGTPPKGSAVEDTRNRNFFFDVAGVAAWDKATIDDPLTKTPVTVSSGKALWGAVKTAQWERAEKINQARLRAWQAKLDPMPD